MLRCHENPGADSAPRLTEKCHSSTMPKDSPEPEHTRCVHGQATMDSQQKGDIILYIIRQNESHIFFIQSGYSWEPRW